jgi:SAM-dependent methyltransferase
VIGVGMGQPLGRAPALAIPAHLKAVLDGAASVEEIECGIWTQRGAADIGVAQYDSIGQAYETVAGLDIYHRTFWGVSTGEYRAFAEAASNARGEGIMLDAGCGSMLFTARAHQMGAGGAVIGLDASLRMLKLARARIESNGNTGRVALFKGDVLQTPFRDGSFDVVMCMHVAHVLPDLDRLLGQARRVLKPGGQLFLTSIVLANHWRDRYLRALARRRIMASPRRQEDILAPLRALFGKTPRCYLTGSMLFVEALVG